MVFLIQKRAKEEVQFKNTSPYNCLSFYKGEGGVAIKCYLRKIYKSIVST